MAEAPRPAMAGNHQPERRNPKLELELFGSVTTVHAEARFLLHTNLQLLLLLVRAPPSSAVARAAVAGAPLLPCSLPELARSKVAGVAYLDGKRMKRRFEPDRSRRRSRPESSPVAWSMSGPKSQRRPSSRVDPCYSATSSNFHFWKFPEMETMYKP